MIDGLLSRFGSAIAGNSMLAPALALLAGVLTAFTPCCLSTVPLVVGYVGGYAGGDVKKALRYSLAFSLGMAVTFTALGIAASMLGRLMHLGGYWWYILLGALMALMALQTWEVLTVFPQPNLMNRNNKKGYLGAALAGLLAGLFATPCSTPVLIVLLAIVAEKGSLIWGALLLLLYSAGHSVLVLLAGTSLGFVKKMSADPRYARFNRAFKAVSGALMMLLALYMFYLGF